MRRYSRPQNEPNERHSDDNPRQLQDHSRPAAAVHHDEPHYWKGEQQGLITDRSCQKSRAAVPRPPVSSNQKQSKNRDHRKAEGRN